MLETVSSVGRFYHISKHQKMTSTSQQGIVCECTTNSYEFMLSSPNRVWKLYKLAEQTACGPITAWKLAKLFTEACTNKQSSLTSKTVQPTPVQMGSGYSTALMCACCTKALCVRSVTWRSGMGDLWIQQQRGGMVLVWGDLWVLQKREDMVLVRETYEYHSKGKEYVGETCDWVLQ